MGNQAGGEERGGGGEGGEGREMEVLHDTNTEVVSNSLLRGAQLMKDQSHEEGVSSCLPTSNTYNTNDSCTLCR